MASNKQQVYSFMLQEPAITEFTKLVALTGLTRACHPAITCALPW